MYHDLDIYYAQIHLKVVALTHHRIYFYYYFVGVAFFDLVFYLKTKHLLVYSLILYLKLLS